MKRSILGLVLFILGVSLLGCSSEGDAEEQVTYEGPRLKIAVYGEMPAYKFERIQFVQVDREYLFKKGEDANYDALFVMNNVHEEADTPEFAPVFKSLPYPVFFIDTYAEAYVFLHPNTGLGWVDDPGYNLFFATGSFKDENGTTFNRSITYQHPREEDQDYESLYVQLFKAINSMIH
ncbi:hypothetical protein [Pontibacillus marinus]|uniref:Tryptophanyl-tRNA synthetase n=1 Tax=Pontibacillus marinus BH030004 = DSM 16465 TaxID=1385511 RepID=A0A0A5GI52_9BACI|nr:hypothetical protein [Pontibacillus marinus]KGX90805.1 tryptophanyl-tRNA synthetase [Pontibacillus marinus BH030004 = DSM 16465]